MAVAPATRSDPGSRLESGPGGPRIDYLSHSRVPSRDANSIQVMRMCAALAEQGARVTLFCRLEERLGSAELCARYGVPASFEIRGLRLRRVPVLTRGAYSLITLARLWRRPRPDWIHARDPYLLAGVVLCPWLRAPLTLEVHRPPRGPLESLLFRWILSSARLRHLVVISEALGRELVRRYGRRAESRLLLARDGAQVRARAAPPERRRGAEARIAYLGGLAPGKGMELIAELAPLLPEHSFEVVGGSPEELRHWRGRIAGEHVRWHGFLPPERAQELLGDFDVVLAPYQERVLVGAKRVDVSPWMSPLKLFEYMAAGKAIVASDLPVLREFLRDGENARLVSAQDARAWATVVRELCADPAQRERLGDRARGELERHYTWEQRARRLLAALQEPPT